jgi:7-cyano-7-deazaguanine tRNA-ribosyltransferase
MLFPLAVLLGCDLFDSASYAKFARDGRMLFPDGTRRASDLAYLPCGCPTCSRSTVEEMAGSEVRRAEHNLHVSFSEVRRVKQAIHEGALWELAEERARSHPSLLEALRRLRRHGDLLEAHDNIGRSTFLYTGPEALLRPAVARFRRRVAERCRPPPGCTAVVLAPSQLPAPGARETLGRRLSAAGIHGIILSPLGPVPLELGHIYPVGQAVLPADLDPEAEAAANDLLREYLQVSQPAAALGPQEGALDDLLRTAKGGPPRDFAFALARATAEYQFGARGAEALFQGKVELVASRNTGRLRNVLVDGEHVLSLRAGDGLYTLRLPGARRLHAALPPPSLRVVVEADSVPFNRKGLNVFARFVREMDPDLRPGDEVLVTDAEDHLLAVGRTLVVRPEALALRRGMLVRVREGVERHADEGR